MSRKPKPALPATDTPEALFPSVLYSVTQSLALAQRKLKDYHITTRVPRFSVQLEINLQTARYTANTHTEAIVSHWIDAGLMPPTLHANGRLCLAQIALTQSIIQQSLALLRSRLKTAPDVPRLQPTFKPLSFLNDFQNFLEQDTQYEQKRYMRYETLTVETHPDITDFDIAVLDEDIADNTSTLAASREQLDHWTYACQPNMSQLVLIQAARQCVDDQEAILNDLKAVVDTLRAKTIEARLTLRDAAHLSSGQKH